MAMRVVRVRTRAYGLGRVEWRGIAILKARTRNELGSGSSAVIGLACMATGGGRTLCCACWCALACACS